MSKRKTRKGGTSKVTERAQLEALFEAYSEKIDAARKEESKGRERWESKHLHETLQAYIAWKRIGGQPFTTFKRPAKIKDGIWEARLKDKQGNGIVVYAFPKHHSYGWSNPLDDHDTALESSAVREELALRKNDLE